MYLIAKMPIFSSSSQYVYKLMEDSVVVFESSKTGWNKIHESLKGTHPQCIAFDNDNPNRAYCGP